jgi:hypothetical protein
MTRGSQHSTVVDMDIRRPKTPGDRGMDWGSEPYAELRKRNERRARVAQVLQARRQRLVRLERVVQGRRERNLRHGR